MVEFITNVNSAVNGFVWGVPMLVLLVGTGILMTILTKFFQLSHLGHWFKNTVGGIFHDKHVTKHTEAGDQSISQFQSLCTALAATIGVIALSPIVMKITKNYVARILKKEDVKPMLSVFPEIQEEQEKAM